MKYLDSLKKLRAEAELLLLSKGRKIEDVNFIDFPKKWERFGEGEFVETIFPNDVDICGGLYRGKENTKVLPHRHSRQTEQFTVLNKGGAVRIITENEIVTLKYPNSFVVEKGLAHGLEIINDCLLSVILMPKSEKIEMEFLK